LGCSKGYVIRPELLTRAAGRKNRSWKFWASTLYCIVDDIAGRIFADGFGGWRSGNRERLIAGMAVL
jgi:hypothetical protein